MLKEKEALTKRLLTAEKQADTNFDLLESKEAELKDTKAELENILRKANNLDEGAIGLEADLIVAKKQQHAAEKDWKRMTTVNEDQIYDLRQESKGLKYKLALMEDEKSDQRMKFQGELNALNKELIEVTEKNLVQEEKFSRLERENFLLTKSLDEKTKLLILETELGLKSKEDLITTEANYVRDKEMYSEQLEQLTEQVTKLRFHLGSGPLGGSGSRGGNGNFEMLNELEDGLMGAVKYHEGRSAHGYMSEDSGDVGLDQSYDAGMDRQGKGKLLSRYGTFDLRQSGRSLVDIGANKRKASVSLADSQLLSRNLVSKAKETMTKLTGVMLDEQDLELEEMLGQAAELIRENVKKPDMKSAGTQCEDPGPQKLLEEQESKYTTLCVYSKELKEEYDRLQFSYQDRILFYIDVINQCNH